MDEAVRYLKHVCQAWERLRVVYNVFLLVEGLVCSSDLRGMSIPFLGGYWGFVFFFGAVANVFFCLGPLVESYIWLILRRRMGQRRRVLFGVGLVVSMALVFYLTGRGIP